MLFMYGEFKVQHVLLVLVMSRMQYRQITN